MPPKNNVVPGPAAAGKFPRISGRFYTVVRVEHLLYEAVEVVVKDGVVTSSRVLSRAPDLAATAVGFASREIWQVLRTQQKSEVLGEE